MARIKIDRRLIRRTTSLAMIAPNGREESFRHYVMIISMSSKDPVRFLDYVNAKNKRILSLKEMYELVFRICYSQAFSTLTDYCGRIHKAQSDAEVYFYAKRWYFTLKEFLDVFRDLYMSGSLNPRIREKGYGITTSINNSIELYRMFLNCKAFDFIINPTY